MKMEEFLDEYISVYSVKYMKIKFKEYFGDWIIIVEINGKVDVVIFFIMVLIIL